MIQKFKLQLHEDGEIFLRIKVSPNASKNEIVSLSLDGEGEETLKIKIAAAPEKGKANAEISKFFAKTFEIPKKNVNIISGEKNPLKLIKLSLST